MAELFEQFRIAEVVFLDFHSNQKLTEILRIP